MAGEGVRVAQEGQLDFLSQIIAGGIGSAWVRLYATDVSFDPANTCLSYIEASFPGYVPQHPITWGAPFINSAGKAESDAGVVTFTFPGSGGRYKVYGAYVTDLAKTTLYMVQPFLTPFSFGPKMTRLPLSVSLTVISELLS
jgi:hypothetical protein